MLNGFNTCLGKAMGLALAGCKLMGVTGLCKGMAAGINDLAPSRTANMSAVLGVA